MPPQRRKRRAQQEVDYEEVAQELDDTSEDEDFGGPDNNAMGSQRDEQPNLQALDDDQLFGVLKKIACNAFRQLLGTDIGSSIVRGVGGTRIHSNPRVSGTSGAPVRKKTVKTRQNVSYFAKIVENLKQDPRKCKAIQDYGFGSLLSFENCTIPLPFSCWIADHIQVKSSDIVVKNKSIPISVQTVQDVLGIPNGGRPIQESDSDKGKKDFLGALKLTTLPNFKSFGTKLLKDDISDDEIVRSFLIVALCTFLCPNSNTYPSPKYLLPLVDVKSAREWDWSRLVYSWLMKKARRYQQSRAKTPHDSLTLGGCLYIIDVVYLDSLMIGPHRQLPSTLPRITVWKNDMIKEYSVLDCVDGHIFGKRPILPFRSTCYARKSRGRIPSPVCNTDVSDFQKELLHRVPGKFSPQTLDDISALYTKHAAAAAPSEAPCGSAKSIMVDLIHYFYQRSQIDQPDGVTAPMNNAEASTSRPFTNIVEDEHNNCTRNKSPIETGYSSDYGNDNSMHHGQPPLDAGYEVPCSTPPEVGTKEGSADNGRSHDPIQPRDCCESFVYAPVSGLNNTVLEENVESHANIVSSQPKEDTAIASSGNTEVVPSSVGGTPPVHVSSTAETEKVPSTSSDGPDLNDFLQAKKRKLCADISLSQPASQTVATRTRSRRNSLSPTSLPNKNVMIDNPESILRNRNFKRPASRKRKSPLCPTNEIHVIDDDSVGTSEDVVAQGIDQVSSDEINLDDLSADDAAVPKGRQHAPNKLDPNWKLKERLSRLSKIGDQLAQAVDKGLDAAIPPVATTKISSKSTSFDQLLTGDISSHDSRHLQPPSVKSTHKMHQAVAPSSTEGALPKPSLTGAERISMWDIPAPSFSLAPDFADDDDDHVEVNHIANVTSRKPNLEEQSAVLDSPSRQSSSAKSFLHPPEHTSDPSMHQATTEGAGTRVFLGSDHDDDVQQVNHAPAMSRDGAGTFSREASPAMSREGAGTFSREASPHAPEVVPLIAIDSHGTIILNNTPEAVIIGFSNINSSCDNVATQVNDPSNGGQQSCPNERDNISVHLGSSSKGQHPRKRPRRIVKPNSYYRDFVTNVCTARFNFNLEEKLAYECLCFYHILPDYSSTPVIDYGNVLVTYHELGSSLRRIDKVSVHCHVINAFCFKLFKAKPPFFSGRHFFFSTVGDYLIGNFPENASYLKRNCKRCFQESNRCRSFISSDHLIFPIFYEGHWFVFIATIRDHYFVFLDPVNGEDNIYQQTARSLIIPKFIEAWDEFIGSNCDFQDFVIHYAQVPQLDRHFWSMFDDGIFVMKYMELWDPYVNMMVQFQSSNINDIRVKYVALRDRLQARFYCIFLNLKMAFTCVLY
ncbi:unnamed protein product [Urochloa decumbens]|uniref:Ubiquitin-like protease family profile domain-containing protein n=1 Tax=Urochloa decumbens TaxID=240449 RepID=A0ABC9AWZ9_9POAL